MSAVHVDVDTLDGVVNDVLHAHRSSQVNDDIGIANKAIEHVFVKDRFPHDG